MVTRMFSPILKHDQQDATLYNTLYYCQSSACFERCFRSSSGVEICTYSIMYLSDLLVVTGSGSSKQVWQIPDAACTQLSSWWWAEKPLETCRALTIVKSIIQLCSLSIMLKNTLTMHGPINVKNILHPPPPPQKNGSSQNPVHNESRTPILKSFGGY
jgi:hypothetical protein